MSRLFDLISLYPTVRYAAISILLVSVCASLLGTTLVLKRYSMIGDGLSHVAFGTTAIATVLGLTTPIYVTLPLTVLCAIGILKLKTSKKIRGDSAIAMISSASLAFGYLILNLVSTEELGAASDACASLFGSGIIGLNKTDMIICLILAILALVIFILFYNKIFSITFDEDFATATGTRADLYNSILATVIASVIVIAMNTMGALLVSALVTFPSLSAMRLFKTFKSVTLAAAAISFVCAILGTAISLIYAMPIGPTVVSCNLAVFIISIIISTIKGNGK